MLYINIWSTYSRFCELTTFGNVECLNTVCECVVSNKYTLRHTSTWDKDERDTEARYSCIVLKYRVCVCLVNENVSLFFSPLLTIRNDIFLVLCLVRTPSRFPVSFLPSAIYIYMRFIFNHPHLRAYNMHIVSFFLSSLWSSSQTHIPKDTQTLFGETRNSTPRMRNGCSRIVRNASGWLRASAHQTEPAEPVFRVNRSRLVAFRARVAALYSPIDIGPESDLWVVCVILSFIVDR